MRLLTEHLGLGCNAGHHSFVSGGFDRSYHGFGRRSARAREALNWQGINDLPTFSSGPSRASREKLLNNGSAMVKEQNSLSESRISVELVERCSVMGLGASRTCIIRTWPRRWPAESPLIPALLLLRMIERE